MNGAGKKHTLRFDPRTELLLLVLANIVAFTQHSVWVEITWVVFLLLLIVACGCQKSAGKLAIAFGICLALQYYVFPNGPKILASSFTIIVSYARKIFPCLIVGTMVLQKTPVRELMVALRKWHITQGLIIPLSVTVRYFPALKEETGYIRDAMKLRNIHGVQKIESFPPCDFWWKLSEDGSTQRKPKSCGILRILASVFRFYLNPPGFPSSSRFCPEL